MGKLSIDRIVIYSAVLITLIFTPMNFDALIIPKISILFIVGLYLIPKLVLKFGEIRKNRKVFVLFCILILFFCQLLLVMYLSPAPFEQEFFGRTGRGLGLTSYFAIAVLFLATAVYSSTTTINILIAGLAISGFFSSFYALIQRFNLDPIDWNSRTNGIIGTLGNPNFQSSFAAMTFIPLIVYSTKHKFKYFLTPISLLVFSLTLYFTQSTQGYIAIIATFLLLLLLLTWYKNRRMFYLFAISTGAIGTAIILGMLNKGLLAQYLYKVSVRSRGDFWRAAFGMANDHPFFGIGLDSYSDSFLIYRDREQIEMADNAHNYFLEFVATGGYPLAIIYISIILLTIYCFFSLQNKVGKFDIKLASLYCAWLVFQLQSIISPANISLIVWHSIISGFLIGMNFDKNKNFNQSIINNKSNIFPNFVANLLILCGLVIMFPLYNADKGLKDGAARSDINLITKSLTAYPESSVRYNVFTQEIYRLNLLPQALEMGKAAAKFNPNAVSAWALIFVNPQASLEERIKARQEILRLDPLNREVFKYELK